MSNILLSLGKDNEALAILSISLATDAPSSYSIENGADSNFNENDLITFLSSRSKHIVPSTRDQPQASNVARASIRRFVKILVDTRIEAGHTETRQRLEKVIEISSFLETITKNIFVNPSVSNVDCGTEVLCGASIGAIFQAFVRKRKSNEDFQHVCYQCICILCDIIVQLGSNLQQLTTEESQKSSLESLMCDYESLLKSAIDIVQDSCCNLPPAFVPILCGILYLVASVSLMPFQNYLTEILQNRITVCFESQLIAMSIELAAESLQKFESVRSVDSKGHLHDLASTLWNVVNLCMTRLNHIYKSETGILDANIVKLVQSCLETDVSVCQIFPPDTEVKKLTKHCMMWTLINLQHFYESNGDFFRSSMLASSVLSLTDDKVAAERNWFLARLNTSLIQLTSIAGIEDIVEHPLPSSFPQQEYDFSNWLAVCESQLSEIRLALLWSGSCSHLLHYPNEELKRMRDTTMQMRSESDANLEFLFFWVLSTIELAHAEIATSSGRFLQALDHIQLCIQYCQNMIASSGTAFKLLQLESFWVYAVCGTFPQMAGERFNQCLFLKSSIYHRLGDHRKAKAYLLSLADVLGIEKVTNGKDRLHNVQDSILSFATSSLLKNRRYSRQRVQMECLSSPFDFVVHNLTSSVLERITTKLSSPSSGTQDIALDLTTLQDLVSGEFSSEGWPSNFPAISHLVFFFKLETFCTESLWHQHFSLVSKIIIIRLCQWKTSPHLKGIVIYDQLFQRN